MLCMMKTSTAGIYLIFEQDGQMEQIGFEARRKNVWMTEEDWKKYQKTEMNGESFRASG